jgi:hypothetical protein
MSISMHRITVPVYTQMLTNLDFVLGRGAEFAAENGLDEGTFLERKFADDMFPLSRQIQQACFHARLAIALLSGTEAPALPEDPATDFADARGRIADTLAFIGSVDPAALDGDPERDVTIRNRVGEFTMPAIEYALEIAHAQVYFHCTTAYDLLRAEGVVIGKIDFLGNVLKSRMGGGG